MCSSNVNVIERCHLLQKTSMGPKEDSIRESMAPLSSVGITNLVGGNPFKIFVFFSFSIWAALDKILGSRDWSQGIPSPRSVLVLLGCLIYFTFMTKNSSFLMLKEIFTGRVENSYILAGWSGHPPGLQHRWGGPGFLFLELPSYSHNYCAKASHCNSLNFPIAIFKKKTKNNNKKTS